ncbi:type I methionyl aminopeptidase [Paenibacillus albicereus]|uniref:Methionine aminopeptidase n=1 Tax=Paenibacillus albicereus TaxID=2726185 RepID=A0A6H2H182_9BACL|nr:type I methionyl aminopeptidase [Paenibacillus albicereus]QJC53405.1 type I methionyl aminopeptidase [Paenibacillus albicereus]
MIVKSKEELAVMRQAGRIVAECHELLKERVKPGVTTLELDRLVEEKIRQRGAVPSFKGHHGFAYSICSAPNDVICHGFPDGRPLAEGDVISIDIGAFYQGFHGDSAWTYAVGDVSEPIRRLMHDCHEALFLGIGEAVAGRHVGDIGAGIDRLARARGYGNVRDFSGHGVGRELWEEPSVPHYGLPGKGPLLQNGLVLAIEPMFTLGDWRAFVDSDGWTARTADGSICVQYEHSVAITEDGPQILTVL